MDEIKILLGKRIKELRRQKGLSQQQLAEKIDIDQRSLSYIECGGAFPSKCLLKLSNALGVELTELFNFNHFELTVENMKEYIKKNIEIMNDASVIMVYKFMKSIV